MARLDRGVCLRDSGQGALGGTPRIVEIFDDLGIKPLPPAAVQDLYDILEERYQNGSTVITSQLPMANWREVIADEVAYEAIMDRLVHGAIKLELKGESYRKKQGGGHGCELGVPLATNVCVGS